MPPKRVKQETKVVIIRICAASCSSECIFLAMMYPDTALGAINKMKIAPNSPFRNPSKAASVSVIEGMIRSLMTVAHTERAKFFLAA